MRQQQHTRVLVFYSADGAVTLLLPTLNRLPPCLQVEKGTQGIDGRVVNPRSKGTAAVAALAATAYDPYKLISSTDWDASIRPAAAAAQQQLLMGSVSARLSLQMRCLKC